MKHLLILWIVSCQAFNSPAQHTVEVVKGAIVRGTTDTKKIALVFTGDEYGDGLSAITKTLNQKKVLASFFLTGRFYRNPEFKSGIKTLVKRGHYLGAHSDAHLLYCDWSNRDSLLVSRQQFTHDLKITTGLCGNLESEKRMHPIFYLHSNGTTIPLVPGLNRWVLC